jgi:hypothetical protein
VTILVVQLVPQGLIFGADRNVTASNLTRDDAGSGTRLVGRVERPKVLKWPNAEVIIGYAGEASLEGMPTDRWLYKFIGEHLCFESLASVATALTDALNELLELRLVGHEPNGGKDPLLIHLGGFELDAGEIRPRIFYVRNIVGISPAGKYDVGSSFECSNELEAYLGRMSASRIKEHVHAAYFGFRQGSTLPEFNTLDERNRGALAAVGAECPDTQKGLPPADLEGWARHVTYTILAYGAYYSAFYPPWQQLVGGGADVVHVPWPMNPAPSKQ